MSLETINNAPENLHNIDGEIIGLRFDVQNLLGENLGANWKSDIENLVNDSGKAAVNTAEDPTCREDSPTDSFLLVKLNGSEFIGRFPQFWSLYSGAFRELMQNSLPTNATPLTTYRQDQARDSLEVLSQIPAPPDAMLRGRRHYRLDAHVDQRYSAILCVAAPKNPLTGRLVVANDPSANGVEEISRNGTFITHQEGTLLCFPKGVELPHYTEPIQEGDKRIVLSINYPWENETPEARERIAKHNQGLSI